MSRKRKPHDHGDLWDDADQRELLRLRAAGLTQPQMAAKLGRTHAAVKSKLYRLDSNSSYHMKRLKPY